MIAEIDRNRDNAPELNRWARTVPFNTISETPDGDVEINVEQYTINEEIDDTVFALPEEVQKLVDQAAAETDDVDGEAADGDIPAAGDGGWWSRINKIRSRRFVKLFYWQTNNQNTNR